MQQLHFLQGYLEPLLGLLQCTPNTLFPSENRHSEFPRREIVFIKFLCDYLASIFSGHISFTFSVLVVIKLSTQLSYLNQQTENYSQIYKLFTRNYDLIPC